MSKISGEKMTKETEEESVGKVDGWNKSWERLVENPLGMSLRTGMVVRKMQTEFDDQYCKLWLYADMGTDTTFKTNSWFFVDIYALGDIPVSLGASNDCVKYHGSWCQEILPLLGIDLRPKIYTSLDEMSEETDHNILRIEALTKQQFFKPGARTQPAFDLATIVLETASEKPMPKAVGCDPDLNTPVYHIELGLNSYEYRAIRNLPGVPAFELKFEK